MFGKRDPSAPAEQKAPPPAPTGGAAIATRPQRIEPTAAPEPKAPAPKLTGPATKGGAAPKATPGLDQLRRARHRRRPDDQHRP